MPSPRGEGGPRSGSEEVSPAGIAFLCSYHQSPGGKRKTFEKVSFFPRPPFFLPNRVARDPVIFPRYEGKGFGFALTRFWMRKGGLGENGQPFSNGGPLPPKPPPSRCASLHIIDKLPDCGCHVTVGFMGFSDPNIKDPSTALRSAQDDGKTHRHSERSEESIYYIFL